MFLCPWSFLKLYMWWWALQRELNCFCDCCFNGDTAAQIYLINTTVEVGLYNNRLEHTATTALIQIQRINDLLCKPAGVEPMLSLYQLHVLTHSDVPSLVWLTLVFELNITLIAKAYFIVLNRAQRTSVAHLKKEEEKSQRYITANTFLLLIPSHLMIKHLLKTEAFPPFSAVGGKKNTSPSFMTV